MPEKKKKKKARMGNDNYINRRFLGSKYSAVISLRACDTGTGHS